MYRSNRNIPYLARNKIKKALSLKLPFVVKEVYPYVNTNFSLTEATSLAMGCIGLSTENINFHTLPGAPQTRNGISFYIIDYLATKDLMHSVLDME
jgi:anionic cell wall polymer biosynthesis LytR-Cps2A-Psr (LCP) family protein